MRAGQNIKMNSDIVEKVIQSNECDILQINHPIDMLLVYRVQSVCRSHNSGTSKKNLLLVLTTSGGSADSAYKIMRYLQIVYEKITIIVPGWCKSAGTLMATGAHEIQFGPFGELGPLDVQLVRPDALGEHSSGLAIDTAVEKLQHEAFRLFIGMLREADNSEYRISFGAASSIATEMTVGLFKPIFEKLDPISVGEDYRLFKIAEAYAERLNSKSNILNRGSRPHEFDGLRALLEGYPSHGFAIDCEEAGTIFNNVQVIEGDILSLIGQMPHTIYPVDEQKTQNIVRFWDGEDRSEKTSESGCQPQSNEGSDADSSDDTTAEGESADSAGNSDKGHEEKKPTPSRRTAKKQVQSDQ